MVGFLVGFIIAIALCLFLNYRYLRSEVKSREFHVKIKWIDRKGKSRVFVSEDLYEAQSKLMDIKAYKLIDKYLWKK